jgi:hypothetical protein
MKMLIWLHIVGLGTLSYKFKIVLIFVLNSSFVMTPSFLIVFKLQTLFNLKRRFRSQRLWKNKMSLFPCFQITFTTFLLWSLTFHYHLHMA